MDIEANEVVKRTVRPKAKAKAKNILGFMIEGKGENLIRDDQVIDLVHMREHEMAQGNGEKVARVVEEHILALRPPSLREAMVFGGARRPPGMYRLDADDPGAGVPWYHMPGSDPSSDSGELQKSETNPEACWTVYEWIMLTDGFIGTSRDTRYDKPVVIPMRLTIVEIPGYRRREHGLGSYGAEGKDDSTACNHFTDLLLKYHLDPKTFGRTCMIHTEPR